MIMYLNISVNNFSLLLLLLLLMLLVHFYLPTYYPREAILPTDISSVVRLILPLEGTDNIYNCVEYTQLSSVLNVKQLLGSDNRRHLIRTTLKVFSKNKKRLTS